MRVVATVAAVVKHLGVAATLLELRRDRKVHGQASIVRSLLAHPLPSLPATVWTNSIDDEERVALAKAEAEAL